MEISKFEEVPKPKTFFAVKSSVGFRGKDLENQQKVACDQAYKLVEALILEACSKLGFSRYLVKHLDKCKASSSWSSEFRDWVSAAEQKVYYVCEESFL